MRAATILASLTFLMGSMPAQARDYYDLSVWSLEDLCQKKDKRRHAEAIFAEFERRGVFSPLDLELVRSGEIDVGMGEAALQCSWGAPVAETRGDSSSAQVYRQRIDGYRRTFDVLILAERVTDIFIRPLGTYVPLDAGVSEMYSGRRIGFSGVILDARPYSRIQ